MNIVFVSKECPPSPRSCGIGAYVWETGRALALRGHSVTIIAAADDGRLISSTPLPRLTVMRLPDDELGVEKRDIVTRTIRAPHEQGIAYRRRVAECIATLGEDRPDVIEFPGFRGESLVWLRKRCSTPMIVRMHGFTAGTDSVWKDHVSMTRRLQVGWERQEVAAADIITVVSEHQASSVRARFDPGCVRVLHNSIDTGYWASLSKDASQIIGQTDILFAGTLIGKKGIFVLLRAANLLRQSGWRGRLLLAGRMSIQFERFLRLHTVFGKKLPDWVVPLGICNRERLACLYRDAGVCCFPSLIDPFPYTCLEAMACAGLVVGSLKTGMAEMITETSGFLVPPGDPHKLAAVLRLALSMSCEERTRMKEAAQQRARDSFDNDVIIPKLVNVYNHAIDAAALRNGCSRT